MFHDSSFLGSWVFPRVQVRVIYQLMVSRSVLTSTWPDHGLCLELYCLSVLGCLLWLEFGVPHIQWNKAVFIAALQGCESTWKLYTTLVHRAVAFVQKGRYVLHSVVYMWISGLVKSPWTFVCSSDMLYRPSLLSQNDSTIYRFYSWINHCRRIWLHNER